MPVFRVFRKSESPEYYKQDRPRQLCWRGRCLLPGAYRNLLRNVCTIFETLEDAPGIFRSLFQRIKNLVSHFHRCLECCFLAAVLAVREIFGELVPPAADAESPSLERRGFVWYPILEQYYNAVGIKTAVKDFEVAAFDMAIDNNEWTAVLGPHTSIGGLSMKDRVAPFVPVQQAAEWYGEFGTWVGTNGASGVEPTGDFAKLVEIWKKWEATPDSAERDAYNLEIYEIHKANLWTIAYMQSAGTYALISSSLKNYPDNLVSCDLYMYANIVHYETLYKAG